MSLRIQNSRQLLKRTNVSGATPTVNTGSTQHTDGTWTVDEIYAGEFYWNMEDTKLWLGWEDISGTTGVELIYPASFTGNTSATCISDLYISNLHGCSPITIWDDFIQKDGTSINSEDTKLKVTFDDTGEGVMTITKTGGTWTDSDSITVGAEGIQLQTITSASTAYILVENTNTSGTDLNIQLTNSTTTGDLSQIQLLEGSLQLSSDNGSTINAIDMDSYNDAIQINTTSQFNDISFIETSYNTIAASPVTRLKTQDTTSSIVSDLTLSNGSFISTVTSGANTSFIAQSPTEVNLTTSTYVINVKTSQIELNKPLLNTGAWIHKIENERTFDATPTRLDVISFNVPNRVISINATINAYSSTGTEAYGARLFAVFKNVGGTLTQLGITDKVESTDFTTASSDILVVNPFGTDIDIQVTGEAANTTLWTVRYEYQITP
jgi:hypothetical protein